MKLNYNEPQDALNIIEQLTNDESFKMTKMNCRVFDASMQTLKQCIEEFKTLKSSMKPEK